MRINMTIKIAPSRFYSFSAKTNRIVILMACSSSFPQMTSSLHVFIRHFLTGCGVRRCFSNEATLLKTRLHVLQFGYPWTTAWAFRSSVGNIQIPQDIFKKWNGGCFNFNFKKKIFFFSSFEVFVVVVNDHLLFRAPRSSAVENFFFLRVEFLFKVCVV